MDVHIKTDTNSNRDSDMNIHQNNTCTIVQASQNVISILKITMHTASTKMSTDTNVAIKVNIRIDICQSQSLFLG